MAGPAWAIGRTLAGVAALLLLSGCACSQPDKHEGGHDDGPDKSHDPGRGHGHGGTRGGPGPEATGPASPAGLTRGFSPLREAVPQSEDLSVYGLKTWSHFVALGDQAATPKGVSYDVLTGPGPARSSRTVDLRGAASMGLLELDHGVLYMSGRWVLPKSPRIRGTSPGGMTIDEASGGPTATCPREYQFRTGVVVLLSDPDCDILMLPENAQAPEQSVDVVLRGWQAACNSPDEFSGCEVPDCRTLRRGQYMIVTTLELERRQNALIRDWTYTPGDALSERAKALVELVNTRLSTLGYAGFPRLQPLTTPP